jgi:hypothetical protein
MPKARKMCFDKLLPRDHARPHASLPQRGRAAPRAIALRGKQWPNGHEIAIAFRGGSAAQKRLVMDTAVEWTEYANLNFTFVEAPSAPVRISFDEGDGAWSYVGRDNLEIPVHAATMNLGWVDKGVILHEFGHMIGLSHEHQNPAGGIVWNEAKVIAELAGPPNYWDEATVRHNVLNKYSLDQIVGTEFDPESIMLYAFPAEWTIGGPGTEENEDLSKQDCDFIRGAQMYPGRGGVAAEIPELPVNRSLAGAIAVPGEQDVFRFTVPAEGDYVLETAGPSDLVMSLYGPNSASKLRAQNDDAGRDGNPRLAVTLAPGEYHLHVRHYQTAGIGPYRVWVTA